MNYALTCLLLVCLSRGCLAQCGYSVLRLAMDDNRAYRYRCYRPREHDTTSVAQLNSLSPTQWGPVVRTNFSVKERPHVEVSLSGDAPRRVYMEVTEVVSRQRMLLSFRFPFSDAEAYNLILPFAPGRHYQLALDEPTIEGFEVISSQQRSDASYWLTLRKK